MAIGGMIGGALFAGIAALLRLKFDINEAVSTLLLNYVAVDVMLFLIYDPWKDPLGSGQPATPPLPTQRAAPAARAAPPSTSASCSRSSRRCSCGSRSTRTSWGFKLSVVGGNPEAARQAGLRVGLLLLSAMLVGGALAGHRRVHAARRASSTSSAPASSSPTATSASSPAGSPATTRSASRWRRPCSRRSRSAATACSSTPALPAASVNVLMALVLLGVFGWSGRKKAVAA